MEAGGRNDAKSRSDLLDSTDQQFGTSGFENSVIKFSNKDEKTCKNMPLTPKGVENAKKRLRAFSIQKKSSLSPISLPKPVSTGVATVLVGKACGMKTVPKPDPDPVAELKKPPKPPKPGTKQPQESYILTQKKTLGEIEDMKRKMELVELGIPLGLICPTTNSDKAMPTKAMPPIKSFIEPAKVDELIREAKKAKAEGKEFKFDYRKLLPDYDNPFQRKKEEVVTDATKVEDFDTRKSRDRNPRRSDKYDRRHSYHKKNEKDRHREDKPRERTEVKDRRSPRERDVKYKDRDSKPKDRRDVKPRESDSKNKEKEKKEEVKKDPQKEEKGADVNLKDFVVCDSWSDNEEKSKDSTPKTEEMKKTVDEKTPIIAKIDKIDPVEQLRESLLKKEIPASPKPKIERLNPVIDSFKFEIEEPDEDDVLDIFDENSGLEKYSKIKSKKEKIFDSPLDVENLFELDSKDETIDEADDTFLESVINEIKQEDIDEASQDKGLVEYDESPSKDGDARISVTPEMDDNMRELHSNRSDYSDGYKSVESAKSTESGYKSTDSLKLPEDLKSVAEIEKVIEERKMAKYTVDSLETWSFVLKICQPLLFRHDKNKCYKETRLTPKVWFTENPKLCNCVKDRRVVYEELEMCKSELVDSLCAAKQVSEAAYPTAQGWYPRAAQCLIGSSAVLSSTEWEAEDSQPRATPDRVGDISLDKEYQRFMQAVWPEVVDAKSETPRTTPVRREAKKRPDDDLDLDKQTPKRMKTSSEGWSQESDVDEEVDKNYNTLQDFLFEALNYNPNTDISVKKLKIEKPKRKRKHSTSTSVTDSSGSEAKKRKKMQKKDKKKTMSKEAKRRRVIKKRIKKLKDKQNKKKKKREEEDNVQDIEKEKKKKEKRLKKKKQLKQKKKKNQKKKKKAKNVSSSSSSESSSDSDSEPEKKKKKRSSEKKKRKRSSSASTQEELFDVNILKNIKTERITDDEKTKQLEFSPRRHKPREIINVKELQNDFVGNSVQIKKEVEEDEQKSAEAKKVVEEENKEIALVEKQEEESQESQSENVSEEKEQLPEFKEQEESQSTPQLPPEESNHSQCSSQESIYSLKDQPAYEKDESHLRPSSQNSNYSFHDVISSGMYKSMDHGMDEPGMPRHDHDMQRHDHSMDLDSQENYEQGNYEMYEQMAMAYQSDVASQQTSPPNTSSEQRIETVVRARMCGEIKCDWRAGDSVAAPPARPSRWGLKPGDVNIVLTGGGEQFPIRSVVEPVYQIQSLANRTDTTTIGYDEAYMDMYGASDKLQYGDCFSTSETETETRRTHSSSLDDRINLALRTTVLGQVAKADEPNDEKDCPEKGILVTKSLAVTEGRAAKRVSFADGYKPGQDSDVEEPPVRKKKKSRVYGCAWPCPATHPDHVPLWDALPPPPPPPGSPPPPRAAPPPPPHLLRRTRPLGSALGPPPHAIHHKFDPNTMPAFMPPEPPPGLISFQNL